jgi:hypothetical protein
VQAFQHVTWTASCTDDACLNTCAVGLQQTIDILTALLRSGLEQ